MKIMIGTATESLNFELHDERGTKYMLRTSISGTQGQEFSISESGRVRTWRGEDISICENKPFITVTVVTLPSDRKGARWMLTLFLPRMSQDERGNDEGHIQTFGLTVFDETHSVGQPEDVHRLGAGEITVLTGTAHRGSFEAT
jgi:hypothetical protein